MKRVMVVLTREYVDGKLVSTKTERFVANEPSTPPDQITVKGFAPSRYSKQKKSA